MSFVPCSHFFGFGFGGSKAPPRLIISCSSCVSFGLLKCAGRSFKLDSVDTTTLGPSGFATVLDFPCADGGEATGGLGLACGGATG
ncbi:hypothetical protein GUITHDRAFT_149805 [Guillardia theta CCMP2712]|uniref:Uncharacterized protein n=1 Tax=Guillardia theta (strain CCMP2712) TaxID=905079 RepID=L1K548_GUITC|nr:hypothetical protein GUITHDRAFT_149805 [Guillardia theta CCMP2712]EKX55488.1 hypothetical protein GUITHDRAFT_149805 [Guillardia theta CCMP2712]|eukprot:XP_005842468.1 hypothetical protein GUITHDRAFT_149805 [Guillardia theta CCMP2712]